MAKNLDKSTAINNAFSDAMRAIKEELKEENAEDDSGKRKAGASRLAKIKKRMSRGTPEKEPASPSGRTVNLSVEELAREYFSRIGLPEEMSDEMLPVPGYVVHKSHLKAKQNKVKKNGAGSTLENATFEVGDEDEIGDGLTALGDIEVVLKPQISNRTAYSIGDPITSGSRPVRLNSTNKEDISDALIGSTNKNSPSANMQTMLNLLASDKSNDMSTINASFTDGSKMIKPGNDTMEASERRPIEALILGGFDSSEVEQINYPYSKIQEMANFEKIEDVVNLRSIAERLRKSGFTDEEIQYFYSVNKQDSLDTEAMRLLREYRAFQKVKSDMRLKGFNKVKIAHPTGIDIEDPRAMSKGADSANSVESLLRERIMNEITDQAKKLTKKMRDGKPPSLLSERGGLL
jgi:hypothetical protein